MKKKYCLIVGIVTLIIIGIILTAQSLLNTKCYDNFGCKDCWINTSYEFPFPGSCSLGMRPCESVPRYERNNAFIRVIKCLCKKIPNENIENEIKSKFNTEILESHKNTSLYTELDYNLTISEICNEEFLFRLTFGYA